MNIGEQLKQCLDHYKDVIEPMIDEERYFCAGMELGNLVFGLNETYKESKSLMNLRSSTYVFGLIGRLGTLKEVCLEEPPRKESIMSVRELVRERAGLVSLVSQSLISRESKNTENPEI
ncbi:hypothetical protein J4438_02220 [Candidatus Woesearchaeota archaeon]|nr:hypothetical protein [Candidatus Woesearchaeota archaeon]